MRSIDLICMGRVAVDLYAQQIQSKLQDAQTFKKYIGGCAGNIAIGCARMGLQVHMLSKVGEDELGHFVKKTLQKEGVYTDYLYQTFDHLTGLVMLGVCPPDHFPLIFYRENCADMQLLPSECNIPIFQDAKSVLLTGTGFSQPIIRSTSHAIVKQAKSHDVKIILDLDYRPVLWNITAKGNGENRYIENEYVTSKYKSFLSDADLIVGTTEEFLIATGCEKIESAITYLQQNTHATLVLKQGDKGCTLYPANQPVIHCPGDKIDVFNVLGAGDGFLSGFLRGWLNNEPLEQCAKYANAAGAIVVSRHGCAPAIPYKHELDHYLSQQDKIKTLQSPLFHRMHQQDKHKKHKEPMFVFAFDHRQYFEQSSKPAHVISAFKNLLWQGFVQATAHLSAHNNSIGVLVDNKYANQVVQKIRDSDFENNFLFGMPVENSDANIYDHILTKPSDAFIKYLCHFDKDLSADKKRLILDQVKQLYQICMSLDRTFMLEVITSDPVKAIESFYQHGVYPTWWKITAPTSKQSWLQIEDIIDTYDKHASVVVLGGDAAVLSQADFKLAAQSNKCQGFVVGRAIFHDVWSKYSQQETCDIPKLVSEKYLRLIELWQKHEIKAVKEFI